VCGGNLIITKKTSNRGRPQTAYICATQHTRGKTECTNNLGVPCTELTDAVLDQLKTFFLDPARFGALLVEEIQEHEKAPEALAQQRRDVAAQIARLDGERSRRSRSTWTA